MIFPTREKGYIMKSRPNTKGINDQDFKGFGDEGKGWFILKWTNILVNLITDIHFRGPGFYFLSKSSIEMREEI